MHKIIGKISKISLALIVLITGLTSLINTSYINAQEDFSINELVTYNDDNTIATITFDEKSISEGYSVKEITTPEGEVINVSEKNYTVDSNGEYDFIIAYYDMEELEEEKSLTKKVVVSEIDEIGTSTLDMNPIVTPRTSVSNGDVSLNIPAYDENVGWNTGDVKDVEVVVNFGDDSSENKTLEIDLIEGMRYESISIKEGTSLTGVDTGIVTVYPSSENLSTAISSQVLPKRETTSGINSAWRATFGKIKYEFTSGTEVLTIKFKVSVDSIRYYGPKTLNDAITVTAKKSGMVIGGSAVTQSIDAIGSTIGGTSIADYGTSAPGSTSVLASTDSSTEYGRIPAFSNGFELATGRFTNRYSKTAVYTLYYPVGMKFSRVTDRNGGALTYTILEEDESTGKVVIKFNYYQGRFIGYLHYEVPKGTASGTYYVQGQNSVEFTYYDDTTATATRSERFIVLKL
ncbi:MAG: adhesive domain-containing protein [Coprobacillaceae bacterium]